MPVSSDAYAPIAIFGYKRPEHLARLLKTLEACEEFAKSPVFFFIDAAKNQTDAEAVRQTRAVCENYAHAHKRVAIQNSNLGLAGSIIRGVSELCGEFKRVIVLEDDLEVSKYFLKYMNDALNRYQDSEKVFHISGYQYPLVAGPERPFFFRNENCWGWATWERAWRHFSSDARTLYQRIDALPYKDGRGRFDIEGAAGFTKMLRAQADGKLDSWAVCWDATLFLNQGLCLFPGGNLTLVKNAGFDGSGVHCQDQTHEDLPLSQRVIEGFPAQIMEDEQAVRAFVKFYRQRTSNRWGAVRRDLTHYLKLCFG